MKWHHTAMVFVLSVNMAIFMLSMAESPFILGYNATIAPEELVENYNVTDTYGGWSGNPIFDFVGFVVDAVNFLLYGLTTLIIGLPMLLQNMGAPWWISLPLYGIWCFTWFTYFAEIIRGQGGISGD